MNPRRVAVGRSLSVGDPLEQYTNAAPGQAADSRPDAWAFVSKICCQSAAPRARSGAVWKTWVTPSGVPRSSVATSPTIGRDPGIDQAAAVALARHAPARRPRVAASRGRRGSRPGRSHR